MSEAPDLREQEDCPSNTICRGTCDQHTPIKPEHRIGQHESRCDYA